MPCTRIPLSLSPCCPAFCPLSLSVVYPSFCQLWGAFLLSVFLALSVSFYLYLSFPSSSFILTSVWLPALNPFPLVGVCLTFILILSFPSSFPALLLDLFSFTFLYSLFAPSLLPLCPSYTFDESVRFSHLRGCNLIEMTDWRHVSHLTHKYTPRFTSCNQHIPIIPIRIKVSCMPTKEIQSQRSFYCPISLSQLLWWPWEIETVWESCLTVIMNMLQSNACSPNIWNLYLVSCSLCFRLACAFHHHFNAV